MVEATGRHVNYAGSHRWAKGSDRSHKQAMGHSRTQSQVVRKDTVGVTGGQEGYSGSHRLAGRYDVGKALMLFFPQICMSCCFV